MENEQLQYEESEKISNNQIMRALLFSLIVYTDTLHCLNILHAENTCRKAITGSYNKHKSLFILYRYRHC